MRGPAEGTRRDTDENVAVLRPHFMRGPAEEARVREGSERKKRGKTTMVVFPRLTQSFLAVKRASRGRFGVFQSFPPGRG